MERNEHDTLPATVEELAAWMADASPAAIDAQASWWLRALAQEQDEAATLTARRDAELALVEKHYRPHIASAELRAAEFERVLVAMGERMTMPRGRKSVELAWGTIGRRTVPARASVVDKETALAWARTVGAVRVTEAVDVRVAAPTVLAMVAESGEVPDGWEVVAEHEAAFARPNSRVAAGVVA